MGHVRPAAARRLAALGVAVAPACQVGAWFRCRRCRRLSGPAEPTAIRAPAESAFSVSSWAYAGLVWLGRRRRLVTGLVLATIAAIIALDVRGYSFTARRLALGASQTTVAIALALAAYRAVAKAISRNAWRWARPNRSWAMALTSAMALRAKVEARGPAAAARSPTRMPLPPTSPMTTATTCRSTTSPPGYGGSAPTP